MSFLCFSVSSQENSLLDNSGCVSSTEKQHISSNSQNFSVEIRMPGVVPTKVSLFPKITHPLTLRTLTNNCRSIRSTVKSVVIIQKGRTEEDLQIYYKQSSTRAAFAYVHTLSHHKCFICISNPKYV